RYDLAVERLTSATGAVNSAEGKITPDLIAEAFASGTLDSEAAFQIGERMGQGFRVLAICLLVAALAAFPNGSRNATEVPIEVIVLAVAFLERALTANFGFNAQLLPPSGTVYIGVFAVIVLFMRLR